MSNTYHAIYLPVDKPITDGDLLMDSEGRTFTYNKTFDYELDLSLVRPAELMLVEYRFNEMKIIGKPSQAATFKFLKAGDKVLKTRCRPDAAIMRIKITCPTCGDLH